MSTTEVITITGQATVGDIQPLSDEGSQSFLLHGKRVKSLNKSDKKIKRIDIDGKRIYQKAEGLPMADIMRVWDNGGMTITGQATVGDTDGTVVYGDMVRSNETITDYSAFIRYSDHALVINNTTDLSSATNRVAVIDCDPNTKYTITMNMYSRFRVGSYAGIPASGTVLTTFQCHSLDTNNTVTQNGTSQTMTYTTGVSETKLFIGYWTTADTIDPDTIRYSIKIEKYVDWTGITKGYYINSNGTLVADADWCVTDYMPITNSTTVKWAPGSTISPSMGSPCFIEYLADKTKKDWWSNSSGYIAPNTRALTGGTSTAYIRASFYMPFISNCYFLDVTNNVYLFKAG